jgi:hypothetical protein
MAQTQKNIRLRCPVCFSRENDVVLFINNADKENRFYCVKCSFHGTEADVREMYADMRKKYRLMTTRMTLEDQRNL